MNKTNIILLFFLLVILSSACKKEESKSPKVKSFSTLNIEYNKKIPIDKKIKMTLHENSDHVFNTYEGRIERRGGFSMAFAKRSFEIDLKEDVIIAGLPADDDWILNANYIDKTFLRHVIAYELFQEMDSQNEASLCNYAEVQLNGVYNGLYVVMEKLDKSSLNVNRDDSTSVIFKEPHVFKHSYDGIRPQKPNNFHQQTHPKIKKDDRTEFLEDIRTIILNSSDAEFSHAIKRIFDIQNIIDWHLLLLITNNGDGIVKNFYLYKIDTNTPVRVAPWDYDHSFGRDGDNELNMDKGLLDVKRSILFARLLDFDWYRSALKKRWKELNKKNILSEKGLKARIAKKAALIRTLAEKNFEKWPVDGKWYKDGNSFDEEIEIMYQFIDIRHARMNGYFDNM